MTAVFKLSKTIVQQRIRVARSSLFRCYDRSLRFGVDRLYSETSICKQEETHIRNCALSRRRTAAKKGVAEYSSSSSSSSSRFYSASSSYARASSSPPCDEIEDDGQPSTLLFKEIVTGPAINFHVGKVANLTEASVLGSSGQTVALVAMATAPIDDNLPNDVPETSLLGQLHQRCIEKSAAFQPMTVDFRQRYHAVGKIPTIASRADNKRHTNVDVLASRAIDRSLRPVLEPSAKSIQLSCSIQANPLENGLGGHPVALALNSAAVAMQGYLKEPVAAVFACLQSDGTLVLDPSVSHTDALCELLFVGTKDEVIMMEFSGMLSESQLSSLVQIAHLRVREILEKMSDSASQIASQHPDLDNHADDDAKLRSELGFSSADVDTDETKKEDGHRSEAKSGELFHSALMFCKENLKDASLRLFGVDDPSSMQSANTLKKNESAHIHSDKGRQLLTKSIRGRREKLFRDEIKRLLKQKFEPAADVQEEYAILLEKHDGLFSELVDSIHKILLSEAMGESSVLYKDRADLRGNPTGQGCYAIRPISTETPALPGVVHGSSLFTRGETQVLCTVTLGPPKDGLPIHDPFHVDRSSAKVDDRNKPFQELPVGSLRYLKTQEYLESDLNSRKVRAAKEQTGETGMLNERRRAFLQYDFPSYSKGEVDSASARRSNRREVGHGALAEKAVYPVLPSPSDFPYAIRMTSEVTSSNGSSSMASVCGATLALLDAGVPIVSPVAGVSIGLARHTDDEPSYQLLVDITGTEDHYGLMDFKIAGTTDAVTALQLDVKEPLPFSIISDALSTARDARSVILTEMATQSAETSMGAVRELSPRSDVKPSAPRVEIVRFDPNRKKDLLGPGGVGKFDQLGKLWRYQISFVLSLLTHHASCTILFPQNSHKTNGRTFQCFAGLDPRWTMLTIW